MKRAVNKAPVEKLTEADNPSLIKAGEEIHLRVLDDFFIEQELPKWKHHRQEWEELKKDLKTSFPDEQTIKEIADPEKQKQYHEKLKKLKAGDKKIEDDKWNIRGKHEQSVADGIEKTIRLTRKENFSDKFKTFFGLAKKPMPVELAFEELKDHLLHISTEEMAKKTEIVKGLEKKFRESGQYAKADKIKAYLEDMVFDAALVSAGFTDYVSEDQMIEFIRKSERGVMVDFLRYYDETIPDNVLELKRKADSLMVFDNYVIAYYADLGTLKKKAEKVKKEVKHEEAKAVVKTRRDPILFGVIKESRKLYYIADWVTDTDDLTLAVLEEVLGEKRKSVQTDNSYASSIHTDSTGDVALYSPGRSMNESTYGLTSIRNYYVDDWEAGYRTAQRDMGRI